MMMMVMMGVALLLKHPLCAHAGSGKQVGSIECVNDDDFIDDSYKDVSI